MPISTLRMRKLDGPNGLGGQYCYEEYRRPI